MHESGSAKHASVRSARSGFIIVLSPLYVLGERAFSKRY